MSFQAYLDNIKAKTGKTPDDFRALAAKKGLTQFCKFGADVKLSPNRTYINVQRGGKKFAILQPSTADRFDIGIKLKGVAPAGRYNAAGSWNAMVTHRVRISDPKEIDIEVIQWLRRTYEAS